MEQLIINTVSRERRFALLKDGLLERIYIEQPGHQSLVGNIYLGVVERVIPGMNAAFVDIGEEMSGFLSIDKLPGFVLSRDGQKGSGSISSFLHQGERVLVQVEKDAAGTKGARLTAVIEIQGHNLVYMPNGKYIAVSKKAESHEVRDKWRQFAKTLKTAEEGLIFRTESLSQTEEKIKAELEQHRETYKHLQQNSSSMKKPGVLYRRDAFFEEALAVIATLDQGTIVTDSLDSKKKIDTFAGSMDADLVASVYNGKENIFSAYQIEHEIDKLGKRIVWLDKGAYLVIDEAEALTVIDVNTGKFSGKNSLEETVLKTNISAAAEAARQIRLRDLAGIILIDFIDMKASKSRNNVLDALRKELQSDGRRTRIVGFTDLGILQLTRKKTKLSISEALTERCGTCGGTGRVLGAETMAYRLERSLWEYRNSDYEAVLVAASKDVIGHFSGEGGIHKTRLEDVLGFKICFRVTETVKPSYEILKFGAFSEMPEGSC
ncbi:Rne/Rng family ribonuclease [Bacillus sp. REN3]|uniref:Rne/Rng family ribonuclease n=1 Tax=Bacillus sp. REN3 TaxID=2802440 RepID=UPI001AEF279A|nr:Rne/Rng family ribonuclease [Bacillus sp. REN3]